MLDLREPWVEARRRRPAIAETLSIYDGILDLWARVLVPVRRVDLTPEDCRARWSRGVPLLADVRVPAATPDIEPLLERALEVIATLRPDLVSTLDAFAARWDRGQIGVEALVPAPGRIGATPDLDLDEPILAFLGIASLRPALETSLASCRHLRDGEWSIGVCPYCGAPPGWGDIAEDGRLELACHFCGGAWSFSRLRCPFCGTEDTRRLRRLAAEGAEQAYAISTCDGCRNYLKQVDRRERWNAGPPIVEDWSSPHLDLVARRHGYVRPLTPVILAVAAPPSAVSVARGRDG